jgi:hypothetical protein
MTDIDDTQTNQQLTQPDPRLRSLDRLVGTWKVSGPDELDGMVRFEWLEGGFFLVQHFELNQHGHKNKGVEYIGFERSWEQMQESAEDSSHRDITSRIFDNQGNTFTYTWEIEDDTLTIWGGTRGSPAKYEGKFSEDGNTNSGRWVWPGGGYESTMTRIQ